MIDAVEPLSLVVWGVFFLAAGMYPLGFMLGAPCSPCCGGNCIEEVEFNRCIRFVNTNTSAPPTTYTEGQSVDMPMHGYSRAVTRPEQIGAMRVATKYEATLSVTLEQYAASMSDGETRSSTYRMYYRGLYGLGDLGTAFQWNVTLQGVTRPLEMPVAIPSKQSVINGPGELYTRPFVEYGVGDARLSSSAAVSASIHSVSVVSGGQWLDGVAVTDSTLKSLLAVSIEERNSNWVARLDFSPGTSVFQYVPFGSEASLSYVIKHSRGAQHRFKTFQVTVFKGSTSAVTAIPSGGLQAVATSQPPYEDTPYGVTPPVFSVSSATIYSDNAVWNGPFLGIVIPFPTKEVTPSGETLRADSIGVQSTNGQFMSLAGNQTRTVARGWIMRAFDPSGGYTFDAGGHPAGNQWNYDVEAVEAFLAGNSTMPYDSGTTIDTPVHSWTMQVSDPTQFCGYGLCSRLGIGPYEAFMYGDVIENTATCQVSPLPQTTNVSTENTDVTYNNRCYGQDVPPVIAMRLRPAQCVYHGELSSCVNTTSAFGWNVGGGYYANKQDQGRGVPITTSRGAPVRYFYCGDLLWAIEHGPCRTSVTIPYFTRGDETYSLGGSDSVSWTNNSRCAYAGIDKNGKCHPNEATLTLDEDMLFQRRGGDSNDMTAGKVVAGDYVMSLIAGSWVYDTNCNQQVFWLEFPAVPIDVPIFTSVSMSLVRRRELWCGEWDPTYVLFQGLSCYYGMTQASKPYSGLCATSIGGGSGNTLQWPYYYSFPGSVVFSQQTSPFATTVAPQTASISAAGGNVSLSYCCPEHTQLVQVPPYTGKFPRTYIVESNATDGSGATAYITQSGYSETSCPFDVLWLSGSTAYISYYMASEFSGRIIASDGCPILGQVTHSEQPGCEWSVTTSATWIVASKRDDDLLKIIIDDSQAAVFDKAVYYNSGERLSRHANVTVSSLGVEKTWTIIQLKP